MRSATGRMNALSPVLGIGFVAAVARVIEMGWITGVRLGHTRGSASELGVAMKPARDTSTRRRSIARRRRSCISAARCCWLNVSVVARETE
jgi:hypothetical protein